MNNCDITLWVKIATPLDQRGLSTNFVHNFPRILYPSYQGYISVVSLLCLLICPHKVIHIWLHLHTISYVMPTDFDHY